MNRVKLSFDEKKVEEERDISPYASYMHLSHAPYANSIPIIESVYMPQLFKIIIAI